MKTVDWLYFKNLELLMFEVSYNSKWYYFQFTIIFITRKECGKGSNHVTCMLVQFVQLNIKIQKKLLTISQFVYAL